MAGPYSISITNGAGSENILNGSYSVTTSVTGYDNTTINPNSVDIVAGTNTYNFTVAAAGTLSLHVSEEGTSGGEPIVGATFIRCSSDGVTEYGTAKTTNASGVAVFDHVPFGAGAPQIHYKQTASDGEHEFDATVKHVTMAASAQTIEVQNAEPAERTIGYTDQYYSGLPIDAGTITLTEV